jgi:hypothetical protein
MRLTVALVCMLTLANLFLLRTHFNFAMVCMVKPASNDSSLASLLAPALNAGNVTLNPLSAHPPNSTHNYLSFFGKEPEKPKNAANEGNSLSVDIESKQRSFSSGLLTSADETCAQGSTKTSLHYQVR